MIRMIVIGAAAGALQALGQILPLLPADFPVPVLVVVHVPADRNNMIATLFRAKCPMIVREPEDKEPALAGTIYFAPPGYHLLIEADDLPGFVLAAEICEDVWVPLPPSTAALCLLSLSLLLRIAACPSSSPASGSSGRWRNLLRDNSSAP